LLEETDQLRVAEYDIDVSIVAGIEGKIRQLNMKQFNKYQKSIHPDYQPLRRPKPMEHKQNAISYAEWLKENKLHD
jgi:hypothetical protein